MNHKLESSIYKTGKINKMGNSMKRKLRATAWCIVGKHTLRGKKELLMLETLTQDERHLKRAVKYCDENDRPRIRIAKVLITEVK